MTLQEPIDILLVDDKEENLLALEAVLKSPDYNLIKRNSGAEALKYLLNHECAIILLDVQMPEMDGFETANFIKQSERSRNIPIIFITAISTDDRFVQFGYKSGAVDYIFKPFEPAILRSKVAIFADLYRSRMEIKRQGELLREVDRKERERALAELELRSLRREQIIQGRYRDLVESIQHAIIWSADLETSVFHFVSPSAENILGYPLEEWTTQSEFWGKCFSSQDFPIFLQALSKLKTKESIEIEHRCLSRDRRTLWFRTGMRVAKKADGQEGLEVRGLSIDITQKKEAEEALKLSEERSKLLAEASLLLSKSLDYQETLHQIAHLVVPALADWYEIGIWDKEEQHMKSISFNSVEVQERFLDHIGTDASFVKMSFLELAQNGKAELYASLDNDVATQRRPFLKWMRGLGLKSSIVVPLIIRGKIWGAMCLAFTGERIYRPSDLVTVEDLAQRVATAIDNSKLFQNAQAAVKARDEFLSIASHELKTPLTPLRLHTQLLLRTLEKSGSLSDLPPERITRMISTSDRQIDRMSQLVDDLLDISRINIGRLDLNVKEFDLSELVLDVIERFSGQVQAASCKVEFGKMEKVWGVWDRSRIEQVFINLFTNAMKYGAGKPIRISIEGDGKWGRLCIEDNGIGIAKEDQVRIFQRFERAVSSTHFGGLGLGLYIAFEIVKAHGGHIKVQSEQNKGSAFTLELPCLEAKTGLLATS